MSGAEQGKRWTERAVLAAARLLSPVVLVKAPSGWRLVFNLDDDEAHSFADSSLWTVAEAQAAADGWLTEEDLARCTGWVEVQPGVLTAKSYSTAGTPCGGCGRATGVDALVFSIGTDSMPLLRVESCTSGVCVDVVAAWIRVCAVQFRSALIDAGVSVSET